MASRNQRKTIELALQGGGAHGALTWGVLDRLLEEDRLDIVGISGTSAGAMNAVVLADGLTAGGPKAAREKLEAFWAAISRAAAFSPIQRSPFDHLLGNWNLDTSPAYLFAEQLSRTFSPYELNPLDINPLRDLVTSEIDFARVNACQEVKVFVTATNVRSGRPQIFRQPDLSAETLMASAALPLMYQAVEIDGEHYWDGGFMGNPALFPLVDESEARDLVLVQINPFTRKEVPRSARDIINRLNEITFNASLMKELRAILLLKQLIDAEDLDRERYRDMRLHRINADEDLAQLSPSSKLNAEWAYLQHLKALGRSHAERWLRETWDDLGQRSSFDAATILGQTLRPADIEPSTDSDETSSRPSQEGARRRRG